MTRWIAISAVAAVVLAVSVARLDAGPEKIAFPANWKEHVLYATLDRHDTKQYRELYGSPDAVRAAKDGRPIPSGSVLTLVQYEAQVDAQGNPVKDANGRLREGRDRGEVVRPPPSGACTAPAPLGSAAGGAPPSTRHI